MINPPRVELERAAHAAFRLQLKTSFKSSFPSYTLLCATIRMDGRETDEQYFTYTAPGDRSIKCNIVRVDKFLTVSTEVAPENHQVTLDLEYMFATVIELAKESSSEMLIEMLSIPNDYEPTDYEDIPF